MHKSDGAQPMDEDAAEATPAGDLDMEPGEQPVPKKQKVSGRTDPSAKKVSSDTLLSIILSRISPFCHAAAPADLIIDCIMLKAAGKL